MRKLDIPTDLHFPERRRLAGSTYLSALLVESAKGDALRYAAQKLRREVHGKLAREAPGDTVASAHYYIAYEVVLDNPDTDPGGPVRPPADRPATGVVLDRVLESSAA